MAATGVEGGKRMRKDQPIWHAIADFADALRLGGAGSATVLLQSRGDYERFAKAIYAEGVTPHGVPLTASGSFMLHGIQFKPPGAA